MRYLELGSILKEIRINRGYSQLGVAHKIISQGVYSKVEAGTRDLDAVSFLQIANRMNVTPDEIEFISNNYDYNHKQRIVNDFFKLSYNQPDLLTAIKDRAMDYLKVEDDLELREIHMLCEALLIVSDSEDYSKAVDLIEPIWKRVITYDQWYLYDIRLINMILFMYPIDTTIAISERVLKRLEDYSKYDKVESMKDIYSINLSLLYIRSERYADALYLVEERLTDRHHMNYTMLSLFLSRRALCKNILGLGDYEDDQESVRHVLQAYGAIDLLSRIEEEFEKYAIITG